MTDPTRRPTLSVEWQALAERVARLERSQRLVANYTVTDDDSLAVYPPASTTFGNPHASSPGGNGPAVTVEVPPSGRLLVIWSARVSAEIQAADTFGSSSTAMAPALSGDNTVAASEFYAAWTTIEKPAGTDANYFEYAACSQRLYTGLNAGSTTVTIQYAEGSTGGREAVSRHQYLNRVVTAVPL